MRFIDGQLYEGQFEQGKLTGYGILFYVDGGRYEGQLRSSAPDGHGVFFSPQGRAISQGFFQAGELKTALTAPDIGSPSAKGETGPDASPTPKRSAKAEHATSSGTGFFVSSDGRILTNQHVVADCQQIRVSLPGTGIAAATLVATDTSNDLALLTSQLRAPAIASFRAGRSIRPGESVIAFGFPLAGALASSGNVSVGNVTAMAGLLDDTRKLQISVPVQPGNSGGPLLDISGNVVGVVTSKLNALRTAMVTGDVPQNVNFAIKASVVEDFLDVYRIPFQASESRQNMTAADVGERARQFTVLVECIE